MPRCTSTPRGRLDCSGGMGHTWGALSLQDTWQANEHTGEGKGRPSGAKARRGHSGIHTCHRKRSRYPEQCLTLVPTKAQGLWSWVTCHHAQGA